MVEAKLEGAISLGILFCGGGRRGLALQRIGRSITNASGPDQPGEIDVTCDAGRDVSRARLPGGFDFVCSGLRRCILDFGRPSSAATISHARCQNSTSRPDGRSLASQR